jgi:hypothetical protein
MSRGWRQQSKPRITPDEVKFAEFSGVVNTRSRKDTGLSALVNATNVYVSDTKKVTRRDGYSIYRSGNVQSAYGCGDNLYIVDNGSLYRSRSTTQNDLIASGFTGSRYEWDDTNGDAYFANGIEAGILRGDQLLPWRLTLPAVSSVAVVSTRELPGTVLNVGKTYTNATFRVCATYETSDGRESAPSEIVEIVSSPLTSLLRVSVPTAYARTNIYCTEADGTNFRLVATTTGTTVTFNPLVGGRELTTLHKSSLPAGVTHVAIARAVCFVAQYLPEQDVSVVWMSEPLAFHLWDEADGFFVVKGEVGLLLSNNGGLLVGTTDAVYQYNLDGELKELCDYGVVPGSAGDTDAEGMAYFWTVRGICKAMPFENLTENDVSMPAGLRVASKYVYVNGMQQFITVAQGGGDSFNARRERQ